MRQIARAVKIIFILISVIMASQCATYKIIQRDLPIAVVYAEYSDLQPGAFKNEIEKTIRAANEMSDASAAAHTYLKLAVLYAHYRNPAPDYHSAVSTIEMYASLNPYEGNRDMVQNWRRLLEEISALQDSKAALQEKAEKSRLEAERLDAENKALSEKYRKEIDRLDAENKDLIEKLKQLKDIDIELEEKRKLIK
ncbi:MAG: hypothetical protein HZC49_13370 [Nitrospirae bacterium]|nr:hypothetical protein [Nitrospirota bacterium]